mmetsp:Transcript_21213/g.56684  ORF Transcript_21213/g.56684 Transcript_21213/m.56684 type:complete len:85 (+) Transcript_21213:35-289(+)
MNDAELAGIVPDWREWPKQRRDEKLSAFQAESVAKASTPAAWRLLEARTRSFERDRFLRKLPPALAARDVLALMDLLEDWDEKS